MKRSSESKKSSSTPTEAPKQPGRFQRIMTKIWWLHSLWALAFGIGVMVFAKEGLRFANQLLLLLGISWFLVFLALRFVVGRQNTSDDEKLAKKGLRLLTNYVIKNLYQQMLFFLVPLYAYSATWSLSSLNWLIPIVLLVFAVLSTMDLVFDNFVMEHRIIASIMYGVCMFGVLNLILPMVFHLGHFQSLWIAAAATAPAVALLTFPVAVIIRPMGLVITVGATAGMIAFAYYGRRIVPPVPTSLGSVAVGHGQPGEFECLPGRKKQLRSDRLKGLRCAAEVVSPAGVREEVVHVWSQDGTVLRRAPAHKMRECHGDVYRSYMPDVPADPTGTWRCTVETDEGQLLGDFAFKVVAAKGEAKVEAKEEGTKPPPETKGQSAPSPPKTSPDAGTTKTDAGTAKLDAATNQALDAGRAAADAAP